jgi:hypothetical protein
MTAALVTAFAASAGWFGVYRLPFAAAARRARLGMAVGGALGCSAQAGFTIFATLWYVAFGIAAAVAVAAVTGLGTAQLVGAPAAGTALAALGLSVVGAVGWIGASMSAATALWPALDVPRTVTGLRWVRDSLALRPRIRWLVPLCGAVVEEVFYRGTVFLGLQAAGLGTLAAAAVATALFTVTQMGMTETWPQAGILAASSLVVSAFGCLLVAGTSSVLPAVALHGSFAAFYSRGAWTLAQTRNQVRMP